MNRVKELREKLNMSQLELARKAKVAQSTIHYIETGQKSPTYRVLKKLAAALGVTVSELLGEDTDRPQSGAKSA